MASKTIRWAMTAALAAPLTGCDSSKPSGDAATAKAGVTQPAPTQTPKEQAKKSAGLKSAVD